MGYQNTLLKAGNHSVEKLLNTYSFVIIAFIIATTVFLITQSRLGLKAGLIATVGTIFTLLIFHVMFTNSQQGLESSPYPAKTGDVQNASLVEVYSNF
jgi:hydrogenase-4 membrane subunit HyfE